MIPLAAFRKKSIIIWFTWQSGPSAWSQPDVKMVRIWFVRMKEQKLSGYLQQTKMQNSFLYLWVHLYICIDAALDLEPNMVESCQNWWNLSRLATLKLPEGRILHSVRCSSFSFDGRIQFKTLRGWRGRWNRLRWVKAIKMNVLCIRRYKYQLKQSNTNMSGISAGSGFRFRPVICWF